MEGWLIDPRQCSASYVKGRPADLLNDKGHLLCATDMANGDTLFYLCQSGGDSWCKVGGRRFSGSLFLAGGHTSIEEYKTLFSFGYVER